MKTYKIELSSEPLREGCLTDKGIVTHISDGFYEDGCDINEKYFPYKYDLKHLKCYEEVLCHCYDIGYPVGGTKKYTEITYPQQLQKIWEAIRGEEPIIDYAKVGNMVSEHQMRLHAWRNFTLKEGTYEVDFEDNILPEEITCMNELMHGEVLPDNNGCISIKDRDQQLIKILSPIGTNIPDPTGEYSDLFAYLYDKISPLLKQK